SGAACSPLNCGASQFSLAGGSLLGYRTAVAQPVTVVDLRTGEATHVLPAGLVGGDRLVHQAARTLVWFDAATGTRLHSVSLRRAAKLVGVSQDGSRAVVSRLVPGGTEITVVSPQARRTLRVAGRQWQFDALRGDNMFLIKLVTGGYQVRLLHVASGRLAARPLKDPHESGTIWGSPYSRLSSADGRFVFTLYLGSNGGAMIHELDLQTATARCIDLPGTGDYGSATSWSLTLARGGTRLWAISPGYGRVVAIDVSTRTVTEAFRIDLPNWNLGGGTSAALSPGGTRVALADGETVAVLDLGSRKIVQRDRVHALALGYAPDGRLWKLS
ncbi:MAG: hypothetical protein QOD85_1847, partial [Gaiellaceae bacterium]|nr:hypothetical protein [Gaiellaceae bacterium]